MLPVIQADPKNTDLKIVYCTSGGSDQEIVPDTSLVGGAKDKYWQLIGPTLLFGHTVILLPPLSHGFFPMLKTCVPGMV